MALSQTVLTRIALDITSGLSHRDRFARLVDTVKLHLLCDAAALLEFRGQHFVPLATAGLAEDVAGRHFVIGDHPRLEAIARAGDLVRFPADSDLADPYDGLIPNQGEQLRVHACIGLPLFDGEQLIGAITLDAFDPARFDGLSDLDLRALGALAAASLKNALLIAKLEQLSLGSMASALPDNSQNKHTELLGQTQVMETLRQEIQAVAATDLSVLILGETGTGKELVARQLHQLSRRVNGPLVYLNCAALPESVAESELFGHVKGAFTGAINHRSGKFESADKGTLFLDEIGELPLGLQAKLLRVLQYGDVQRIGDDRSLKVDVRIIAATNRDLKQEILAGRFRADLYHRLSVFPLHVPPLRDRLDDLGLLCGYFLEQSRQRLGLTQLRLSPSCLSKLRQYDWPGNVRELEHAIHRASALARAALKDAEADTVLITEAQFELTPQGAIAPAQSAQGTLEFNCQLPLKQALEDFQTHYINQCLVQENHNWAACARRLGLDPGNLHRLARRLGLK
ncbi:nitric oxide reductase transcriptional regulator NorR [Shewanella sedimentimangrovi]|uniref:Nitric oxide reductase transcriptional regulator NorR n=1 Tax=Shewanella sedimentimangrovi TaxID=2814293 RepID=A0ABX7R7S2_9GAMM|nr:nitric oxide reductase transcriptional regulator NorR [Shewanella sedimentimangrovi]QSX39148.1 nitric oxide reductase transcriptional regulator NorR [Shewanella sedimentimangrovi]